MRVSKKINILLIEDNPSDAKLIRIYLKEYFKEGFFLTVIDLLSKGIETLEQNNFNIVIVDLNLPDSRGIETFYKLYDKACLIPIIVLTGLEDESLGVKAMKLGAQDFLIKGQIDSKGLMRAIHYSIERFKLLKDISENSKKLAEKTADLQSQKQKLSEAQRLARIGSWEWDLNNRSLTWSDELYRIHGMNPIREEITVERVYEMIHRKDREYVKQVINDAIKSRKSASFYYRIVVNNVTKTLHSRGRVIIDEKGAVTKMVGTNQDVTERVIEEEMEKLAMVASKSYNSVIIANRLGKIEWVNEGFTKLTGYTLKDVKDTHGEILRRGNKTGLSQETDYYKLCIKEKKPLVYEEKNYSKSGNEYWVITTLTPVLNEDGEVERIIVIDSDITLRKKIEQDLINANKIAEQSLIRGNNTLTKLLKAKKEVEKTMKIKEQFLANMSHEIRTPMHSIEGFTDLLLKTKMTEEQKQFINAIKTSCENLLIIINDILDFSKIQSGRVPLEKIDFELSKVVFAVSDIMLPRFTEKKIKLSISIDKNIPNQLIGDPFRLNQILLNLLGNAIKFTEKGEVKISIYLTDETEEDVTLNFSVRDTGIGIPKNKLDKIFEEFAQVTSSTSRKYGGNGLGLTIAKQLIEIQGGKISVKSTVGLGSTFSFVLKAKKKFNQNNAHKNHEVQVEETPIIECLKILLVEDNEFNQMLAKEILLGWKWDIEIVGDGYKAIESIRTKNFDLVLMDIQLPNMDGYETTKQIRNTVPSPKCNIPIVAITANAILNEEIKCRKMGMNGYISKPFKEKDLYFKILSVLGASGYFLSPTFKFKHNRNLEIKKLRQTDLLHLEELSEGNNEFVKKMIQIFIKQTPEILTDIEKHFQSRDWKLFLSSIHKIKPSVSFFGLKKLGKVVDTIEQYSVEDLNKKDISELIKNINELCTEAILELKTIS